MIFRLAAGARDFWLFWSGQLLSNMGRSFSSFAFPLLVYELTHSALSLTVMWAALFVPELLFGLLIGAWSDRVDRKRLMIVADVVRCCILLAAAGIGFAGHLQAWMLYAAGFGTATLDIAFESCEFASVPALVPENSDLGQTNSRMVTGYYAGALVGPLLAGLLVVVAPLQSALVVDAGTYLVSAATLLAIRVKFTAEGQQEHSSRKILADVREGLRYVLRTPTVRNISLLAGATQFVTATVSATLVLFATANLHASKTEFSFYNSAQGLGVIALSLVAARAGRRWGRGRAILASLVLRGAALIAFALTPWYWLSLVLWAIASGAEMVFGINADTMRQTIVPNHMLGRVASVARLVAFSSIPIGSLVGGWVLGILPISHVYLGIGVLVALIPVVFTLARGVLAMPAPAPAGADTEPVADQA